MHHIEGKIKVNLSFDQREGSHIDYYNFHLLLEANTVLTVMKEKLT